MTSSRSVRMVPAAAMTVVVCLDAAGTVSVSEFLADTGPLVFGTALTAGAAVAVLCFLAVAQRNLLSSDSVRALVSLHRGPGSHAQALRRALAFGSLARLDWPLFAVSASLMAPAVASIIFLGLWPVMFILLLHRLTRLAGGEQYSRMRAGDYGIMMVGAVGLALVVLSQQDSAEIAGEGWRTAVGACLALLAVSLGALGAFHYSWGRQAAAMLPALAAGNDPRRLSVNLTMLAFLAANTAALPVLVVLGVVSVASGSSPPRAADLMFACAVGALIVAPEGILTRFANLRTTSLAINAISYLSPVASAVLFAAVGRTAGVDTGLLTVGTSGIVAVNLMLNFDPEAPLSASAANEAQETRPQRRGFKALVVALWISGGAVYFREDLLGVVGVDTAVWANSEYWAVVALSATVFILILSFRHQRLEARVRDEQAATIGLFRRVERLHHAGTLPDGAILDAVLAAAGRRHQPGARDSYLRARAALAAARSTATGSRSDADDEMASIEIELDALMHSKQGGREFTEMVALVLFGFTTAAMVLLARPEIQGWGSVLADVFGTVFVAGVVFLYVALLDAMHARDAPVLEPGGVFSDGTAAAGLVVVWRDDSRNAERVVSLMLGAALLAVYCVLFWGKHVAGA